MTIRLILLSVLPNRVTRLALITQLGGPPTIDGISTDVPDNTSIPAEPTGPITATITLGGGATGWTATKGTDPSGFIESFTTNGGASTPLEIAYNENTGAVRDVTFTITTTGGTGTADTRPLLLRQEAGPPTLTFTADAEDLTALTASGITFTIDVAPGGGATGWEAEVTTGLRSGSEGFVEIDKTTPGGGEPNVIMVTVGPNETTDSRNGEIMLTSEGGGGTAATQVVSFTQEGSQGIRVVTDPVDVASLSSAGGMFTIDVTLLGSATSWTYRVVGEKSFSVY